MLRVKQQAWIEKMKKEHYCFRQFLKVASTPKGKESYSYKFRQFTDFCTQRKIIKNNEDFEPLLKLDPEQITDLLIEYIDYNADNGVKHSSIGSYLSPVEAFFEMNRKLWHKKLIRRSNEKEDKIPSGNTPATDDDVLKMVNYAKTLRNKTIILFLSSTGVRPAALVNPILKIKHLVKLPYLDDEMLETYDYEIEEGAVKKAYCYGIKIYDESKYGYWVFLTPETTNMLEKYFQSRINNGEKITVESPIFSTYGDRFRTKYDFLTDDNLSAMLEGVVTGAGIKRIKIGNRYDKAITYMFRKRFNGKLKMENSVNSNIAEKLMAHKKGLDGAYLQPTMSECYREFFKAISELTVDPKHRHRLIVESKNKKISELEQKEKQNTEQQESFEQYKRDQQEKMKKMQAQMDRLLHTAQNSGMVKTIKAN